MCWARFHPTGQRDRPGDKVKCPWINLGVTELPKFDSHSKQGLDLDLLVKLRNFVGIAHHMPGRIRLRLDARSVREVKKVNSNTIDTVLGAMPGITDFRINTKAGSIVINYDINEIEPSWWRVLLEGKEAEAKTLLNELLTKRFALVLAASESG